MGNSHRDVLFVVVVAVCVCVCVPECVVVSHIVLSSQRTFTFTCRFGAAVWNSLRT